MGKSEGGMTKFKPMPVKKLSVASGRLEQMVTEFVSSGQLEQMATEFMSSPETEQMMDEIMAEVMRPPTDEEMEQMMDCTCKPNTTMMEAMMAEMESEMSSMTMPAGRAIRYLKRRR